MTLYSTPIPFLAVLVSMAAVPLILLTGEKRRNLREFWTLIAAVIKFLLVFSLLPAALDGMAAEWVILTISPGIELRLVADNVGLFFALVSSSLWILTSFYSIGYVRGAKEHKQTRYFASFAVCLSATIGIAFSANLLTFVFFYEILSLATYPLVIHKETEEARRSGRQYLAFAMTAGLLLVMGTAWVYIMAGTTDFNPGGILGGVLTDPWAAKGLFLLLFTGVGVKAGIMPLQSWLPAAMVAPTPVSALLHAVAVVKSGVFGVIRMAGFVFGPATMQQFGLDTILAVFAAVTIIVASLIAMRQDNLKRRLAYSTVGHLSYIVLGVALLTASGFTGGLLHLAFHATTKITLFFCAGAIYVNLHRTEISQLNGIGRAMPWTMGAFTIGSMGLAGVPPINAFVSKFYLCQGTLQADNVLLLCVFLLSGVLNMAYFFPIVTRAFFKKGDEEVAHHGEASPLMVVPICITALASVVFGLFPDAGFHFFELATRVTAGVMDSVGATSIAGVLP